MKIIKTDKLTVGIKELGAELASVTDNCGKEYIWQGNPDIWSSSSPILFPFCGRVPESKYSYSGKAYETAPHGFFRKSSPVITLHEENKIVFELSENENTIISYPFKFKLILTYIVTENKLSVSVAVKNTGDVDMPFMFGAHPGFTLEEGTALDNYILDVDTECGKIYRLYPDRPFAVTDPAKYSFPDGKYHLSLSEMKKEGTIIFSDISRQVKLYSDKTKRKIVMEYSNNLPFLALWNAAVPGAEYICLEPWSGIPTDESDITTRSFTNHLAPGAEELFNYTITFM